MSSGMSDERRRVKNTHRKPPQWLPYHLQTSINWSSAAPLVGGVSLSQPFPCLRSRGAVRRPIINIASTFNTGRPYRLICLHIEIGDFTQKNAESGLSGKTKETLKGGGRRAHFANFKRKAKLQEARKSTFEAKTLEGTLPPGTRAAKASSRPKVNPAI
jgi:hypothetical protein